jgi:hypothetical protein
MLLGQQAGYRPRIAQPGSMPLELLRKPHGSRAADVSVLCYSPRARSSSDGKLCRCKSPRPPANDVGPLSHNGERETRKHQYRQNSGKISCPSHPAKQRGTAPAYITRQTPCWMTTTTSARAASVGTCVQGTSNRQLLSGMQQTSTHYILFTATVDMTAVGETRYYLGDHLQVREQVRGGSQVRDGCWAIGRKPALSMSEET